MIAEEGRLDRLAADPLLLQHAAISVCPRRSRPADLDADARELRVGGGRGHSSPRAATSNHNWLGTDDRGRDVLARLIYRFRISVLFGLVPDHRVLDHRSCCRRGAGLFRRLDRPLVPAPPHVHQRGLVRRVGRRNDARRQSGHRGEIDEVPKGTEADIDRAVAAARAAFEDWSLTTPGERSAMLWKWAQKIEDAAAELSQLESANVGKPKGVADFDIEFASTTCASSPAPRA